MEYTSDRFDLLGRTFVGRYRVERVVAKGGFGVVYQARHVDLDTPVALKVLAVPEAFRAALRPGFIEMFEREARTIAALAHPAIVRVLDYGSASFPSGEAPWMALDWLEGRTLEADLAARPAGAGRSPREALDLLRPAFDALCCAHAAGIAHRDVKPANLMLVPARRGDAGLRLLDFGIAKVMEEGEVAGSGQTATRTEIAAYSLHYASPEQLSHARTGPWTDVHALALVVVELLTGHRAYRATEAVATYAEILDRKRPTPKRVGVDVGPWEEILDRALALHPAERHPDADHLLADLEAHLDAADAAWRAGHAGPSLAPATLPRTAPVVNPVATDTLAATSAIRRPPPSSNRRGLVPLTLGLGLAAWGAWKALSPPTTGAPAAAAARPAPAIPAAPVAIVPSPAVVAPSTDAAVASVAATSLRRAARGRHIPRPVAPVVTTPPPAPAPNRVIVIE